MTCEAVQVSKLSLYFSGEVSVNKMAGMHFSANECVSVDLSSSSINEN